jgi:hypothetical protein
MRYQHAHTSLCVQLCSLLSNHAVLYDIHRHTPWSAWWVGGEMVVRGSSGLLVVEWRGIPSSLRSRPPMLVYFSYARSHTAKVPACQSD